MGAAASSSSSTTTGQQRGSKAVREDSPPVKSPPVLPKYVQGVPGPLPKSPPVLPKYVQHVNETIEGLKAGYYPRKSPPPGPMDDSGGKAAARGAAAMGTTSKGSSSCSGQEVSKRPARVGSAWPEEYPPWVVAPKPGPLPHPSEGPRDDPHRAYPSPWDRPHWPQVPRLVPPVGDEGDTLVIQPSLWWNQELFDKVQRLVDEEATKFRPVPRTDAWDYLRLPLETWMVRRHSLRVQRFHPEHRSTPEDMRDLEYLRVTVAWLLNQNTMKFSERLIYVDAEWHKDGLPNLHGKWCGFSFFLVKDRVRVAT